MRKQVAASRPKMVIKPTATIPTSSPGFASRKRVATSPKETTPPDHKRASHKAVGDHRVPEGFDNIARAANVRMLDAVSCSRLAPASRFRMCETPGAASRYSAAQLPLTAHTARAPPRDSRVTFTVYRCVTLPICSRHVLPEDSTEICGLTIVCSANFRARCGSCSPTAARTSPPAR